MGLRLIIDPEATSDAVAMYDSVSGFAFGPVFNTEADAQNFIEWLDADARSYGSKELQRLYGEWVSSRKEGDS